jgi:hypothetical protein
LQAWHEHNKKKLIEQTQVDLRAARSSEKADA